ncbi:MAG: hypothetical protein ACW990_18935, partial [Promethearchaeota archaeon]
MKDEKYIVLVLLILLGVLLLIVGIINIGKFPMLLVIGLFLIFFFPAILLKYPKYAAVIMFITVGVFIISFGIYLGWRTEIGKSLMHYSGAPMFIIIGGIIIVIASPLRFIVKSNRQKKLDSISKSDLIELFEHSTDGTHGIIKYIKLEKDQILVRQKSTDPKKRLLRIPIRFKDQCIPHFRKNVFRCFKCGKESTIDHMKHSGPFTLVKLSCPTHGTDIPHHKIWSSIYDEISKEETSATQSIQPKPISSEKIK